ncbi:class I SAM-dependent methyltransferase [Sporanaerobium hydrogeniformans]|uniref:class I SAM-dependent methyltransferase n=1 Tax=Sporanaerobium hydrogeniformans TaxID=3072179 RepID=UPI0015D4B33D|nr:class I SAM-dependent methyltransferase [Sporanaerobium hydrogeniformans]
MISKKIQTETGNAWRAKLKLPDGKLTLRAQSEEVEKEFWRLRQKTGQLALDSYREPICKELLQLLQTYKIHSALEMGPGWGNYTFFLAKHCKQLTCVDISQDNLDYLNKEAKEKGLLVPHLLCSPWEEVDISVPTYDLVFGYNCFYRMTHIEENLLKMHQAASRLCVIGMNSPPELPWLPALEKELHLPVRYTRVGCKELQKILSELGIQARRIEIPNQRNYVYSSIDELVANAERMICGTYDRESLETVLLQYHEPLADGALICRYVFTSELLVWETFKK